MVVHVVAVVPISNVDVIVVIPVIRPIFRPGVAKRNPITLVLEARVSAINHKRETVDPKRMLRSEIAAIPVFRNTVAVVAASLLPGTVVCLPACCAMILPGSLLITVLLLRVLLVLFLLRTPLLVAVILVLLLVFVLLLLLSVLLLAALVLVLLFVLVLLLLRTLLLLLVLLLLLLLLNMLLLAALVLVLLFVLVLLLLLGVLLFRLGLLFRLFLLLGLVLLIALLLLVRMGRSSDSKNQGQYSRTNDCDLFHASHLDLPCLLPLAQAQAFNCQFNWASDGFTETASSKRRCPCEFGS